jgi:putative membrane protein
VLRGFAMGAADVVPGVSGGTMALVLGIYERLIAALRAVTSLEPWRALLRRDLRSAWRAAHAPFLAPLVLGIAVAVLALARVMEQALRLYHVPLHGAFLGLILAAAILVARRVGRWDRAALLALAAALALTTALLGSRPQATPDTPASLFVAGAIGITALVLPGISGAFILVLLGQYARVIGAIAALDLATLLPFAFGALLGLATTARALDVLLRRARAPTMAALLGVLIASVRRVWPWMTGGDPAGGLAWPAGAWGAEGWIVALVAASAAFATVLWFERRWGRPEAGT